MATWNINGLAPNRDDLILLMDQHKLDIVLITEAHCTGTSNVKIRGSQIYTTNHPDGTAHAGTAIVVRDNIKHHLMPEYKTPHIQATVIAIEDKFGCFSVAAVYCPPKHKINSIMFSHFFTTLGHRFIAGGDWNSKHTHWGSRLITTRGRQLKLSIDEGHMSTVSTSEPTSWPADKNRLPDLLDFFIIKGLSRNYTKVESCLDGSSDHTPVLLTVSTTVIEVEHDERLTSKYTDWQSFREYIDARLNLNIRLKEAEEIELAVLQFTNLIQVACWKNTPTIKHKDPPINIPLKIKEMILEKRRLRRVWHASRHPSDKTALNKAIVLLKNTIREANDQTMQTKLEDLTATKSTNYSLWKFAQSYDRPKLVKPPIRTENNEWARTGQDKANLFAEHLRTVFTPNDSTDIETERFVDDVLQQDFQMDLPPNPVSPVEVVRTLKRLDNKKAPGYDLLTKEVLLELPRKAIIFLVVVFNAVLRLSYYPDSWKISEIIMIHKPGKPSNEKTSYRPISLLPCLSKLFEKILLHRITPSLIENKVIPDHQFGFRAKHGTVEQVHRVCDTIRRSLEEKLYCSSAFLDVQQAFDKVWHRGLLCKIKANIPHSYFMLFQSYISKRRFYVKEDDATSSLNDIKAGVPQGSVMGPVMYTLYTSDIPVIPEVTTATFADDTAIMASHENPELASKLLQKGLDAIYRWLQKWKVKASASKSVHITFTLKKGDCPSVKLGEDTLPHCDSVKYLGLHLDRRLTWRRHIDCKKEELSIKYRSLYWMLGRNSRLSIDNKLLIYKQILKPVWTYALPLWGSASTSNIQIMQRQQNKILRSIANVPWYITNDEIHEHLNMATVKEEIHSHTVSYKERLTNHPNKLARQLTMQQYVKRLKRHHILELDRE